MGAKMRKEIVLIGAITILMIANFPAITTATAEPNNSFENAVLLKEKAKGSVGIDDIKDIYKFYVTKGTTISLELISDGDADLYLYNPEKKGIAYSCACKEKYERIFYNADETGYWYAEVIGARNSNYEIILNLIAPQNDAGYLGDAGNSVIKSFPIFPNEPIDNTPGRGNEGMLSPPGDKEDWYMFSVCKGQTIRIEIYPTKDFDLELYSPKVELLASSSNSGTSAEIISYQANQTGNYFMRIYTNGNEEGNYIMDVELIGQNDADSSGDAGNDLSSALHINPGKYYGFLDYNDRMDCYSFNVQSGQAIKIKLESPLQSDFNVWLYNPDGKLVHQGTYYGDDEIEYPADISGTWKIKIDMFPGWDEKWDEYPVAYYKYGSGAYEIEISIGGTASMPPVVKQPEIIPIAQTFIVKNSEGNKDEYSYIAAIPAANYIEEGKRYVSPIVYEGDETITNWFGTVDDTTNYLLEDWNEYLSHFGKKAKTYYLEEDPIKAAANLAMKWKRSEEAVVVIDGSNETDEVKEIFSKEGKLKITKKIIEIRADSPKLKELEGQIAYIFFVGPKWGAIKYNLLEVQGYDIAISLIDPKYREAATDWWPYNEDRLDIYHPVTLPGIWAATAESKVVNWKMHIELISGKRYYIPIKNEDSTLKVTVETNEPSYLWVYLVDPLGNIMAPDMPAWNGGKIKPIHHWNGNKTVGDEYDYSHLIVEPHTSFSAEVNHPMKGIWTAIVVPREEMTGSIKYRIKAEIREYNKNRIAYGLSAANGAVIASLKHIPLLYASKDGLPDETLNALNSLGVNKVIFIDLAKNDAVAKDISSKYSMERITTIKDIVSKIVGKENYITITSFATGDGYFAQAAYLAAYHASPVLRIGEMGRAYHWANIAHQWMYYAGDYYHGCRSIGHLAMAEKPIIDYIKEGEIPPIGLDADLRWMSKIVDSIYKYVKSLGINIDGIMEAYGIVAPKKDIRFTVTHPLIGNESTAGQFIGKTPAEMAAYVARSILYPALIFANPHKEYTTTSFINYQDGREWSGNDRNRYNAYTTRENLVYFRAYGREYRGHCVWDNLLVEQNNGVSVYYYTGHGTGGSGVSEHPVGKGIGIDGWRGYAYWSGKTPRSGGFTWYDPEPPFEYDIIHFKWCDMLWENLHSSFICWMSCTTFAHFGPEIYLEHGAVAAYGNANTGLSPTNEIMDLLFFKNSLYYGLPIGEALGKVIWRFDRDYTTRDPTSIYGRCSLNDMWGQMVIYGDPMLIVYSPAHWIEPTPVDSTL